MPMQFHYHPLSSFCWKVLIALYEKDSAFEPVLVNLGDPAAAAAFCELSPMGKMPTLVDGEAVINESSIEIEYLDRKRAPRLIPDDADAALQVRYWDRFFDHYVHYPMQAIVADRLRPADKRDALGVAQARAQLATALNVVDKHMSGRSWAATESFSLADCAAAPALYYADKVAPFEASHSHAYAYLQRLAAQPSFARVLSEAGPYLHMFPEGDS